MTRTSANMASSFQPAGHTHRGAGGRKRQVRPSSTFSPAPSGPPPQLRLAQPLAQPGPCFPAKGSDPSLPTSFKMEGALAPHLSLHTPPGSRDDNEDCFWGGIFQGGGSWASLTGLVDHVSQQEAGFLGRAGIPAASGHLGDSSQRCLCGQLHTHPSQIPSRTRPRPASARLRFLPRLPRGGHPGQALPVLDVPQPLKGRPGA